MEKCTECGCDFTAGVSGRLFKGRRVCTSCEARLLASEVSSQFPPASTAAAPDSIPAYRSIKMLGQLLRVVGFILMLIAAGAAITGCVIAIVVFLGIKTSGITACFVSALGAGIYGLSFLVAGECLLAFRDAVQNTFYLRRRP